MNANVVTALIGIPTAVVSAFATAYFTSVFTAETTARVTAVETTQAELERIGIVSAFHFNEAGKIVSTIGKKVSVSRRSGPFYEVKFLIPLEESPIVLAVGNGGERGANVRVKDVSLQGFILEGRSYDKNGLTKSNFNVVVFSSAAE